MLIREFLSVQSKTQKHTLRVYCDDSVYVKRRDGGKQVQEFEIRDNALYFYTKQSNHNKYTVTLIYQYNLGTNRTKRKKTEVDIYVTDDISLARFYARRELAKRDVKLQHKNIYSFDVQIRMYTDKKKYEQVYFRRDDLE